ncbi:peptidase S28 [Thelephora ganbajun]|uniref:Peptidase S28 n=1 Tax=Thelephora ganbajun TaxID=370292 RepID=A0ACB6Z0N0_THEGA|nr:peptidase S28 [Thelephora ganbajun]
MRLSPSFLNLYNLLCLSLSVTAFVHTPQAINFKLLERQTQQKNSYSTPFTIQDSQPNGLAAIFDAAKEFPEQWFTQPVDHFSQDSPTFRQRYWVNNRHYVPGTNAPVIVIDGGETSGEDRLPFLDTGIADILAKATGGIGVVLEHRMIGWNMLTPNLGESIPVANLTTDSLRWLTNEQAVEDSARFMAHVKFEGINEDLTALKTPWIYYGGSYAGARAAHMRVLHPGLVFGAVASSAVTHASVELWEYMDVIRRFANRKCSWHLENLAVTIDSMLSQPGTRKAVKTLFGLSALEHDYDFVTTIEMVFESWQAKNWDPEIGSEEFEEFCKRINHPFDSVEDAVGAIGADTEDVVTLVNSPGFDFTLLNYAAYVRAKILPKCPKDKTIEQCFGTFDDAKYQVTSLDQEWRLWLFQVCTQWGYFFTSPPDHKVPRIVSRLHTLENESKICRQAFPPGEHLTVPPLPNVTAVNALGDFSIAKDRLAIIDGEVDPWRPMTPHSDYYAQDRLDTISEPFKIIPNGVHHWDENGLRDHNQEPPEIQKIHREIVEFVQAWLKDFKRKDWTVSTNMGERSFEVTSWDSG